MIELDSLHSRLAPVAELVHVRMDVEEFLLRIDDPTRRKIATMKLDGYTNQEISRLLEVSKSTFERKLAISAHLPRLPGARREHATRKFPTASIWSICPGGGSQLNSSCGGASVMHPW